MVRAEGSPGNDPDTFAELGDTPYPNIPSTSRQPGSSRPWKKFKPNEGRPHNALGESALDGYLLGKTDYAVILASNDLLRFRLPTKMKVE